MTNFIFCVVFVLSKSLVKSNDPTGLSEPVCSTSFHSMKELHVGALFSSLDGMLVHRRTTPSVLLVLPP